MTEKLPIELSELADEKNHQPSSKSEVCDNTGVPEGMCPCPECLASIEPQSPPVAQVEDGEVLKGGNPYLAFDEYICRIPLPDGGYSTACIQGPEIQKTRIFVQTGHEKELESYLNTAYKAGLTANEEITWRHMKLAEVYRRALELAVEATDGSEHEDDYGMVWRECCVTETDDPHDADCWLGPAKALLTSKPEPVAEKEKK